MTDISLVINGALSFMASTPACIGLLSMRSQVEHPLLKLLSQIVRNVGTIYCFRMTGISDNMFARVSIALLVMLLIILS